MQTNPSNSHGPFKNMEKASLKQKYLTLLRWQGWFFIANAFLFYLLGLRYLFYFPIYFFPNLNFYGKLLILTFAITAYLGHLALLACAPLLLCAPLTFLFPKRNLILSIGVIIAAISLCIFIIDGFVFALYRFHLNGIVLKLFFSTAGHEIFDITWLEYSLILAVFCGLLLIETLLAIVIWKTVVVKNALRGIGKWLGVMVGLSVFISWNLLLHSGLPSMLSYYSSVARIIPLYTEFFATLLPGENDLIRIQKIGEKHFLQPEQPSQQLRYPLHSIQRSAQKKALNVLWIVIDSWRFDMLNPMVTPHLYRFSKHAILFKHHVSGGNATQPGVFTLFYSIPGTYWSATVNQHIRPLIINVLLKQGYRFGVFASAPLTEPAFNENIFYRIKNIPLNTPGNSPKQRDQKITQRFLNFLDQPHSKHPFFGFLFYDASHGFCRGVFNKPFQPTIKTCNRLTLGKNGSQRIRYFNRYKNALFFIDQKIHRVLTRMQQMGLLKNTVIIITGDHGQEFDDNRLGYWGHASNFTRYQIDIPLIWYWPGVKSRIITYKTSHFDVAPTLLKRLFKVNNPTKDFSVGYSLFNPTPRKFLIVSSYIDFAILTEKHIVVVYPTGNYQIESKKGKKLANAELPIGIMTQAFKDMRRFYR